MNLVVKYFSEIAIKSRPVRRRLVSHLVDNLRDLLRDVDPAAVVERAWDKLTVVSPNEDLAVRARAIDALRHAPGITYILEVNEYPLGTIEEIVERVLPAYAERLAGRTFAVRCKRSGHHDFTSVYLPLGVTLF